MRVAPQDVPTVEDLSQPMTDKGQNLTIPKTWMSDKQIMRMVQQTPKAHVYKRKGKGGQVFDYVTGSYVEKVLNFVFGWNWDFEVMSHGREQDHVWVLGKLTVHGNKPGQQITKTQFGRAEVKYLTESKDGKRVRTNVLMDFGNDLKSATTDSLKKCASLLGIASDIYGKADYKAETGAEPREKALPALAAPQVADGPVEEIYCHGAGKGGCPQGAEITSSEREYSVKMYGKPLCRECIKLARPKK